MVELVLAALRVARLAADDDITEPVRSDVTMLMVTGTRRQRAGAAFVVDMLRCPWCVTVWGAIVVVLLEQCGRPGRLLVRILAVAEAAGTVRSQSSRSVAV